MTKKMIGVAASRFQIRLLLALIAALVLTGRGSGPGEIQAQGGGCAAAANPIACENALTGDIDWDVSGSGDASIQGFASDISVNRGQTVDFKINTNSANYTIDIYRLGHYGGAGARKVATLAPSASLPQTQPPCATEAATGLIDCGTWAVSASWAVPASTVSGVHIAKLTRADGTGGSSHIVFIVRDDARQADMVFQTSDTTWVAYNMYGGVSLYCGGPVSNAGTAYGCPTRGVKVSYNRPFDTRVSSTPSWLFNAEYPMIRWLEANGYNVKYWAGVDSDRRGADLVGAARPKVFLSVGHDEYWSGNQRASVEAARAAGVNLAFFSGNEIYWKTRYEASIDGADTPYKTLVTYKETLANKKIDPMVDPVTGVPIWTGTWRDPRFSPPGDGGRPENELIGSIFTVVCCTYAITVPEPFGKMRLWRNTPVATLVPGQVATLAPSTLGYEWGEDLDNGFRPAGVVQLSSTTVPVPERLIDFGSFVGPGTATHSLTLYRHSSGALVFGASTVQWSWGLDENHDRGPSPADPTMRQATVNLFADMGVQPDTLQPGLIAAVGTTDIAPPTSIITAPASGSTVQSGSRVTINGTAVDGQGAVAAVEISADGGATWKRAQGRSVWTFEWIPGPLGPANIRSRAIDDSGNIEAAGAGITVNVGQGSCPCTSLFDPATEAPVVADAGDASAVNLGVKFRTDTDGYITGMRYYKSLNNVGTHVGTLWTMAGSPLAQATFTNESVSGWQEVVFSASVPVAANTTYVASYHTNVGHYAATGAYFANAGIDRPPLHAPTSSLIGGNGVFSYGVVAFPTSTFNATNYWVDVIFAPSLEDATAPTISGIKAVTIDSSRVIIEWTTDENSTSRIDVSTDESILSDLSVLPPGTITVTDGAFVTSHALALNGLTPFTTYYYRVTSVDPSGNAATAPAPSFTVPGPTLRDSVTADFAAGSNGGSYVAETGDGEVILEPALGTEFSGTTMPSGWLSLPWGVGGFSTVGNGVVMVDGSRLGTCVVVTALCEEIPTHMPTRSLEFVATFTGDAFQHAGLAVTFMESPLRWAIFSTAAGGSLWTRTMSESGLFLNTELGTTLLGAPHKFRIQWNTSSMDYYVDDVLRVSHPLAVTGPMRPLAASDFSVFGGFISVDWMRLTPYAASGTFTSRVFDAGSPVPWRSANWTADVPAGTSLAISVRAGDVLNADGSVAGPWIPIAASGAPFSETSRYIQYQAQMETTDPDKTPVLSDIIISTNGAPTAVNDSFTLMENSTSTFPASGPRSLTANDTDPENDPLTVTAVTQPAHGKIVLNTNGSVSYTPALNYNGPDSFNYTVSDGLLSSSATVALEITFVNNAPTANPDFYNIDEDASLTVPASLGLLRNDTDVEGNPLTVIHVSGPNYGALVLNADGSFFYRPVANFAGPDIFYYKVNDGSNDSNVAAVQILMNQVNDPPIAEADTYSMVRGQVLSVPAPGVLRNDHDIEAEATQPLTAIHEPGSGPLHGTLTLAADGSFTYEPASDYIGGDTFAYRAKDHLGAVGAPAIVTITINIKAVSEQAAAGETVSTGTAVSSTDPVQSAVTPPASATVSITEGVIAASQAPTGYTFLNRQVNIAVTAADGTEITGTLANPLVLSFLIDGSLVPSGETHDTTRIFRNGVLLADCLGATSIPGATSDPCVSRRETINGDISITLLTTHASRWNMGLSSDGYGTAPFARNDTYTVPENSTLSVPAPGVLVNDLGGNTLSAVLVEAPPPSSGDLQLTSTGSFTFTPASDFYGTVTFTYKAHDGASDGNPATATLAITPVNHAPTFTKGPDVTVLEDAGVQMITPWASGIGPGRANETGQTLNFIVTNDNPGLFFAQPAVAVDGTLTFNPRPDAFGSALVTVRLHDNGGTADGGSDTSAPQTVVITILPVNDAPSFTQGVNQVVNEDSGAQLASGWASNVSPGPANEEAQAVHFSVSNDNNGLFEVQPAVSDSGTLTYTPASNANGMATVTVLLRDEGGTLDGGVDTSAPQTFTIEVQAVNDAPSFTKSADQSVLEDAGAQSVAGWATNISTGPPDESSQTVTFAVTNDNNSLFSAQPAVAADGVLTYTPAPNANGTANVSVQLQDNGGTVAGGVDISPAQTFTITVGAVNDAPVAVDDAVSGSEDAAISGNVLANDIDVDGDGLTAIQVTGPAHGLLTLNPDGSFVYTPALNYNGADSFTYKANDAAADSNVATVAITVNAVNDAPSFVKGADQLADEDGAFTAAGWATSISAGSADEAGQVLTFIVEAENPSLFAVAPAVAANGTLTFTPAPNQNGSTNVTIRLKDDGGTLNGGSDTSAAQTFTITVRTINDAPSFTKGADQAVNEDAGAQTVVGWATGVSAGPADEAGQTLTFIIESNSNPGLFSAAPAVASNGTLTYTPAANTSGVAQIALKLRDNGGTENGGVDTSALQTFSISVAAVNDAPSFAKGANQVFYGNPGPQAVPNWATAISAGPTDEAGQAVSFVVANDNSALFTAQGQPAVTPTGTLTYSPALNVIGTANVTLVLQDNGGTANGGVNASAPQTFTITINKAVTKTTVTSSSSTSPFGAPVTFTATVAPVAPGTGVPDGTVTFKRGTTTMGTGVLNAAGVATFTTSTLAIGSYSITAVYGGSGAYAGSTSPSVSQVISQSAKIGVTFSIHAIQDGTARPRVATLPVENALVRVFTRKDVCTNGIVVSTNPKKWGLIFDGKDGPGGTDPGCPAVSVGNYRAEGTTDANGKVTIIVPPTGSAEDYVIIGRTEGFDYIKTAPDPDTLYSSKMVRNLAANATKDIGLHQIRTFAGKKIPGKDLEEFGSYLGLIEPEFVEWTDETEQYPFVMVAEGAWDVTTSITPPEGFIPDATALSATVADGTTAVQFTLTDVASEWTETVVNHTIGHLGGERLRDDTVPMIDNKPTKANNDAFKVMQDSTDNVLDVLANDMVSHLRAPLRIISVDEATNGVARIAADGLSIIYTPMVGYIGLDWFNYTIEDSVGNTSWGTTNVTSSLTPWVTIHNATLVEGDTGASDGMFRLTLSSRSLEPVTVDYATVDGTATAGLDYEASSGTVTFAPGQNEAWVTIPILGDTLAESHETFKINLSNLTNAIMNDGQAIGTINDDDPPVISVTSASYSVEEGNTDTHTLVVSLKLSQSDTNPVSVDYATTDGTASGGSDYTPVTGTVTFPPGTMSQQISIPIVGDTTTEAAETFYLDISNPVYGTLGQTRATITVTNDDKDTPVLSIADLSTVEGNTATKTVTVSVTLSASYTSAVTVNYATADGTALAPGDYTAKSGTLTFAVGTTTQTISIVLKGDAVGEPTESFSINLTNPVNATLGTGQSTVTITNDDNSTRVTRTVADFSAGTLDAGAVITQTADGEMSLAPTAGAEFYGTSLPTGWTASARSAGGAAVVGNGLLTLDGAAVLTDSLYGGIRSVEFIATFSAAGGQSIGFSADGMPDSAPLAMFVIDPADMQLYARTMNGAQDLATAMSGIDWIGVPHRFRVDLTSTGASYYIDNSLMDTHSTGIAWGAATMRPAAYDTIAGDGMATTVDWIRMSPFAASGQYVSQVFDLGATSSMVKLAATLETATGNTFTLSYRVGDTPDLSAIPFTAIVGTNTAITGSGRYVQYAVLQKTTNVSKAGAVRDVTITYKLQ